mgnify:CR=1 FL=1
MNEHDRETLSARWLITEAFDALLAAGPFERVTVEAIVRKAGISRSTFYLHFRDKFDLLEQATERVIGQLAGLYETERRDERIAGHFEQALADGKPLSSCIDICRHVRANEGFYRNRYRDPAFLARLTEMLCSRLKAVYRDDMHAAFAASGTVGVIGRWLSDGLAASDEEVALSLTRAALYSVTDLRKAEAPEPS